MNMRKSMLLLLVLVAASLHADETIQKTYDFNAGGPRSLRIDDIWGSIHVVATNTNQVRAVIHKSIRAKTDEDRRAAEQEVKLETSQEGNAVHLHVHTPCDGDHNHNYSVKYDFDVEVPRDIALTLRTVNDGNVSVRGTSGDFSVHNVNGSVDMEDVAGSGKATTVNGHIKVSFRGNPTGDSEFSTINGPIELYFTRGLSADFRFSNMNGGVYSDYELTSLPAREVRAERTNGRFVYKADRTTGGRVGSGGPEITVKNMNGDIRVLERPGA